jgi:hypothetical protein
VLQAGGVEYVIDHERIRVGKQDPEGFRIAETRPPPEDEAVRHALRHREVVAEDGGDWRLGVPLMGRWMRRRL